MAIPSPDRADTGRTDAAPSGRGPLLRLVASEAGVPAREVTLDTRFRHDLGLDGYDVLELLEAVEAAFRTPMATAAPESVRTVRDVARLLDTGGSKDGPAGGPRLSARWGASPAGSR